MNFSLLESQKATNKLKKGLFGLRLFLNFQQRQFSIEFIKSKLFLFLIRSFLPTRISPAGFNFFKLDFSDNSVTGVFQSLRLDIFITAWHSFEFFCLSIIKALIDH